MPRARYSILWNAASKASAHSMYALAMDVRAVRVRGRSLSCLWHESGWLRPKWQVMPTALHADTSEHEAARRLILKLSASDLFL